eukprot:11073987-Alexandrium_andersonii.AAC.1
MCIRDRLPLLQQSSMSLLGVTSQQQSDLSPDLFVGVPRLPELPGSPIHYVKPRLGAGRPERAKSKCLRGILADTRRYSPRNSSRERPHE